MKIDPARHKRRFTLPETGIYVRAELAGKWDSFDIALLDQASLLAWLRSRGGNNPWAENVVALLLGHGPLIQEGESNEQSDTTGSGRRG